MKTGLLDIRTQWRKYILTGISMLIGVLGVVAIMVGSSVATDMLVAQQEQLNGREATFTSRVQLDLTQLGAPLDPQRSLNSLYQALRAKMGPQDATVALQADRPMTLTSEVEAADNRSGKPFTIKWIMGDIAGLQRLPVLHGAYPGQSAYPPSIAVNESAAAAFGGSGTTVLVSTGPHLPAVTFRITAEVADGRGEPTAYGSLLAAEEFFPTQIASEAIDIRLRTPSHDLTAIGAVIRDTVATQGMTLASEPSRADTVDSVRSQFDFLSWIFGACAGVVLLLAAVGTANVGLASVAERSRELVVRRAVGARRRDIFAQVMWANLGIGIAVSIVAVTAAILSVYLLLPSLIPTASSISPPTFPWVACAIGVAAAILTSALGGVMPAVKATRLQVAHALRE